MIAFLFWLINENPNYGPVWFGAIVDLFILIFISYLIKEIISNYKHSKVKN